MDEVLKGRSTYSSLIWDSFQTEHVFILLQAVNAARRQGVAVDTQSKWGAATNKQHLTTKNTAKLDRETEELKHDKVPLDLGKLIQQGRQSKNWSQKDLATVHIHQFILLINYNFLRMSSSVLKGIKRTTDPNLVLFDKQVLTVRFQKMKVLVFK
uniref:(California timema) hypothetical protein n=1 Tax=Timema californicum TaxID=61474 RepID=A0A7R9JCK6_TIMCA|nr:unnamed protein product [Timema californicum]